MNDKLNKNKHSQKINKSSEHLAITGILLAFNAIIMLLINYIPTNTIALMTISSLFVAVSIIESEIKYGSVFCLASIFFAFILISNKLHFIVYLLTFGNYGIVKYLIESKIKNIKIQYITKLLYSVCMFIALFIISTAFFKIDINIFILFVLLFAFFIYDYIYTIFINYYCDKIRHKIKRS